MKKGTKKAKHNKNKAIIWGAALAGVTACVVIAFAVASILNNSTSKSSDTASNLPTEQQIAPTEKTCVGDQCLAVDGLEYPAGQLPADISAAVKAALDDEYKAYSSYDAVIARLGPVRPFSMIIRAEESHIASLKAILDKYGEQIPANPYPGKIATMPTLKENCQLGVDAEVANVALYRDNLLPKVAAYPDITPIFTSLMNASNDKHLPAFQRCN